MRDILTQAWFGFPDGSTDNGGIMVTLPLVTWLVSPSESHPADIVAYVDGAEGVFGTSQGDSITGDAGRNILHGGEGRTISLVEKVRT